MFKPNLLDYGKVVLPNNLLALTEMIAENVHNEWAAARIADGWTYGEKRDDNLKQTPCLVPYSELTETEKEYDRRTAMHTLKLIISLGYSIKKSS